MDVIWFILSHIFGEGGLGSGGRAVLLRVLGGGVGRPGMLDVWAAVGGEPRAADCQLDLDEALDLEALNFSPIGAGV